MKTTFTLLLLNVFVLGHLLSAKADSRSVLNSMTNDSTESIKPKTLVNFHFRPSVGLTYGDSNLEGVRKTNLQWLASVNSDFTFISPKFHLSSTLFMQYGQSKIQGEEAVKLQDAFIFSITPSIPIIKLPPLRLFLETTAETSLGKGTLNNSPTQFLDPLFLYQTLFVGQKHYSFEDKDKTTWQLTYGVGYAFQQTLNKDFQVEQGIHGNKADFESGYSGILEFNINSPISESLSFVMNAKAVALSRENFFKDIDASRRSVLVRSGLFYKKVGLEYNYHRVHDLNLSLKSIVDQSIMFTLTF